MTVPSYWRWSQHVRTADCAQRGTRKLNRLSQCDPMMLWQLAAVTRPANPCCFLLITHSNKLLILHTAHVLVTTLTARNPTYYFAVHTIYYQLFERGLGIRDLFGPLWFLDKPLVPILNIIDRKNEFWSLLATRLLRD